MHIFTHFKLALTNLTTASKQAPFKLGQNLAYLALLALIGALPYFL
ncbi:hypothetical protein SAMN04487985_11516 [Aerococcus urinaehominis]|nr:hypothetical protein SAMN04487985_11516 [Aerococcus urinaehominis]